MSKAYKPQNTYIYLSERLIKNNTIDKQKPLSVKDNDTQKNLSI